MRCAAARPSASRPGARKTNADLVAGRDRVRVHGTLHEHTGHGRAEQAAHLHTTVDGRLDVHAASEDTVLLAGHMRDRWDGGAAIVAAMADDTVAGGGIRVTTPLDLWVHGLMGVEERIGTCTADAVLLELDATHYEREYGPGAHAAGLAVYTGSLYQSSRSTFRPLMRVSSGVRNLIAGGDVGDGGGDGSAGGAPADSPPPAPAETGAAEESATATLAAGRTDAKAPATALDTADALPDARRVSLEALVDSVDARASEETGEAGIVMHAEDLPELTRSTSTAGQLGALQDALRGEGAGTMDEAIGLFQVSRLDDTGSVHEASAPDIVPNIRPGATVPGMDAPVSHSTVSPPQPPPGVKLGLPGGADRPPQPAAPEPDFYTVYGRICELRRRYRQCHASTADIALEFKAAIERLRQHTMRQFKNFGGNIHDLEKRQPRATIADFAYNASSRKRLTEPNWMAITGEPMRIREALAGIREAADENLRALSEKFGHLRTPVSPGRCCGRRRTSDRP